MARQTRSQRRARRRAQAESAQAAAATRARQVRPEVAAKTQGGARRREEKGSRRFLAESWGELKKVEWPTQSHVIQGTLVVLIACAIVGTYIWIADVAFKRLVQDVFLR